MNKLIAFVIAFYFFSVSENGLAQDNIGIKFFGLSIHPKGEEANSHLMPNRLDKDAYLVLQFTEFIELLLPNNAKSFCILSFN